MTSKRLTVGTALLVVLALLGYLGWTLLAPGSQQVSQAPNGYSEQPTLGNPSAPVKVILFENFMCEHCKAFEEDAFPRLEREYIETGKAEAYYINLAWGEEDATTVALAGECAYQQDDAAFWEYKKLLFEAQGGAGWSTPDALATLAGRVDGLDAVDIEECVEDRRYLAEVQRDLELGGTVGVQATPSVVVGQEGFEGPSYSVLAAAIDRQLEERP